MFLARSIFLCFIICVKCYSQSNGFLLDADCCLDEKKYQIKDSLEFQKKPELVRFFYFDGTSEDNSNGLRSFLAQIDKYYNLTNITIYNASIDSLPYTLTILHRLNCLTLVNVDFDSRPEVISKLTTLKFLHISCPKINLNSIGLNNLHKLETLIIHNSNNEYFPHNLSELHNLKFLNIEENTISEIPESYCRLKKLESFRVGYNPYLKELPLNIGELKRLNFLSLTRTNIKHIPVSLFEINNITLIISGGCNNSFGGFKFNDVIDIMKKSKTLNWDIRIVEEL